MGLKRKITRGGIRLRRKIIGRRGKSEIIVTRSKGDGLNKQEITDILRVIGDARRKGILPPLTYHYRPPIKGLAREELFLKPKVGKIGSVGVKVRAVVRKAFGSKFKVQAI